MAQGEPIARRKRLDRARIGRVRDHRQRPLLIAAAPHVQILLGQAECRRGPALACRPQFRYIVRRHSGRL